MHVAEILEQLVAFDTQNPPGREAECARFIGGLLAPFGFAVAFDDLGPDRCNVVAALDNGSGPCFAFNTHMDVVPAGEGWNSDPFRLREDGGRLYGRGACDAKGSLAAMIAAGERLAASRDGWSGRLIMVFVADEEAASAGAKRYAATKPRIDVAVVGEPTGNAVVTAHKGSLRPLVRVRGVSAHSGTPDLGVNAVFKAARLLAIVEDESGRIAERQHPLCGAASLTVTRLAAGVADNVVPDRCEFLLDRRLVPGESEERARREIDDLLARAKQEVGVEAEIAEWRPTTGGATETAADQPLIQVALAASAAHGGGGGPRGFQGACDLVHFNGVGADGVVIGPGDLAVAHKPDEFVPAGELDAAVGLYETLARAMLRP